MAQSWCVPFACFILWSVISPPKANSHSIGNDTKGQVLLPVRLTLGTDTNAVAPWPMGVPPLRRNHRQQPSDLVMAADNAGVTAQQLRAQHSEGRRTERRGRRKASCADVAGATGSRARQKWQWTAPAAPRRATHHPRSAAAARPRRRPAPPRAPCLPQSAASTAPRPGPPCGCRRPGCLRKRPGRRRRRHSQPRPLRRCRCGDGW